MQHSAEIFSQSAILFGTALVAAMAFRMLKAPSILGFLCTGILVGPSLLGVVDKEEVEAFAELGLVLLLFVIGLELSPASFARAGRGIVVMTLVQLAAVMAVVFVFSTAVLGLGFIASAIVGVSISLSSTAIVLKTLSDRGEIQTSVGLISTGNLLLQDVYVVVLMLMMPFFTKSPGNSVMQSVFEAGAGLLIMIGVVALLRVLLPRILNLLGRHGGPEFTTLFAVFMAFGGAAFAGAFGWPMPLGSCIAGLLLARADVRHQLVAEITPFRDVFNALFFISLGMLVDLSFVAEHGVVLLLIIGTILLFKSVVTSVAVVAGGWPLRIGIQAGFGLCTVSEFGYVLVREAEGAGLVDETLPRMLIPVIVGTMMIGAILLPLAGVASRALVGLFGWGDSEDGEEEAEGGAQRVVVVGYGVNGKSLGCVLKATRIPCVVVEMNRSLAQQAVGDDIDVVIGDGTRMRILEEAGLASCRALVVAVNDKIATRRIVTQARVLRSDIPIIVRTAFIEELEPLLACGATTVIPADFEVSIKLFAQVLTELRVPDNVIQAQIVAARAGGYGVLRGVPAAQSESLQELLEVFRMTATQTFYISERSQAVDKTIAALDLRARSGVSIIAVVREGKPTTNPPADHILRMGDVLVMVGSHSELDAAQNCLGEAVDEDSSSAE
ncbi:MAG: cation:proton antiporter [Candidatus Hydrogenedentes bacterium]|nr:cation:proton antiporter [Candidatus Hydrogenedentota bacterium]